RWKRRRVIAKSGSSREYALRRMRELRGVDTVLREFVDELDRDARSCRGHRENACQVRLLRRVVRNHHLRVGEHYELTGEATVAKVVEERSETVEILWIVLGQKAGNVCAHPEHAHAVC